MKIQNLEIGDFKLEIIYEIRKSNVKSPTRILTSSATRLIKAILGELVTRRAKSKRKVVTTNVIK